MQYKEFKDGVRLSRLGMGNMRLPQIEDENGQRIDFEKAQALVDQAYAAGVNYFDTAYIYHGGKSEVFTGQSLKKYPRESYYVADKYNLEANPDYEAEFAEQLERLQLDRIDFYLLHGVADHSADRFMTNGCIDYFNQQKAAGKIRFFGFSFHGSPETLRRLLPANDWDFVQIQLNYYDWFFGAAKELYEILAEAGIPVMVMEPVHGGMLAKLNDAGSAILNAADPARTQASWAMRWVKSLNGVQVVLSGMNAPEQMRDNLATFDGEEVLDEAGWDIVRKAAEAHRKSVAVLCTGCRYCTPNCPMELDIPRLLSAYNDAKIGGAWRLSSLSSLPEEKLPSACIGCGACTGHCPQSLPVPEYMREMAEMMGKRG